MPNMKKNTKQGIYEHREHPIFIIPHQEYVNVHDIYVKLGLNLAQLLNYRQKSISPYDQWNKVDTSNTPIC